MAVRTQQLAIDEPRKRLIYQLLTFLEVIEDLLTEHEEAAINGVPLSRQWTNRTHQSGSVTLDGVETR